MLNALCHYDTINNWNHGNTIDCWRFLWVQICHSEQIREPDQEKSWRPRHVLMTYSELTIVWCSRKLLWIFMKTCFPSNQTKLWLSQTWCFVIFRLTVFNEDDYLRHQAAQCIHFRNRSAICLEYTSSSWQLQFIGICTIYVIFGKYWLIRCSETAKIFYYIFALVACSNLRLNLHTLS